MMTIRGEETTVSSIDVCEDCGGNWYEDHVREIAEMDTRPGFSDRAHIAVEAMLPCVGLQAVWLCINRCDAALLTASEARSLADSLTRGADLLEGLPQG